MCHQPQHTRAMPMPTEGCTAEQHQSSFLTRVHPTFKLELDTSLPLCDSSDTTTSVDNNPANTRSSMTEPSWTHAKIFLKHFLHLLQISPTTLHLPSPARRNPTRSLGLYARAASTCTDKPRTLSGTAFLHSNGHVQGVSRIVITNSLFWSRSLSRAKIKKMDRHWEKSIGCIWGNSDGEQLWYLPW